MVFKQTFYIVYTHTQTVYLLSVCCVAGCMLWSRRDSMPPSGCFRDALFAQRSSSGTSCHCRAGQACREDFLSDDLWDPRRFCPLAGAAVQYPPLCHSVPECVPAWVMLNTRAHGHRGHPGGCEHLLPTSSRADGGDTVSFMHQNLLQGQQ